MQGMRIRKVLRMPTTTVMMKEGKDDGDGDDGMEHKGLWWS